MKTVMFISITMCCNTYAKTTDSLELLQSERSSFDSIETRRQIAQKIHVEISALDDAIPNPSPDEIKWIEDEKESSKYKTSFETLFDERYKSLISSSEYQKQQLKTHVHKMSQISRAILLSIDGYDIAPMSDLPNSSKANALAGQIYLSNDGHYIFRDLDSTVIEGKLDSTINLDDLDKRIYDLDLKTRVWQAIAEAKHIRISNENIYAEMKSWAKLSDLMLDAHTLNYAVNILLKNKKINSGILSQYNGLAESLDQNNTLIGTNMPEDYNRYYYAKGRAIISHILLPYLSAQEEIALRNNVIKKPVESKKSRSILGALIGR